MRPEPGELFGAPSRDAVQPLSPGATLLAEFALGQAPALISGVAEIAAASPFRHMVTPGGWPMSVAMTNCGPAGWVTDRGGYRYDAIDPVSERPWPPVPAAFDDLALAAAEKAGFPGFRPDACLVNRYGPGARLALHQDRNELDISWPIVSVSLGLPATLLWGGQVRADRPRRIGLFHGDVVVWGGPARMTFHGVEPLSAGEHPLTGAVRFNLTFRKAR
jgi:alkylated DNA repair protein (DNA oxidative demethylase)